MRLINSFKHMCIDECSATPKYIQLTNYIISAIEAGSFHKNDILPSICDISSALEISRDTAEKAYKNLKRAGVLKSVPGKGFYVSNSECRQTLKVCLLFNKFSTYKKIVYDEFVKTLGTDVPADLFIYHNDLSVFENFLSDKLDQYSHFVILPHFIEGGERACEIINSIPSHKLVILDNKLPGIHGGCAAVYEDFENNIFKSLEMAVEELNKYHTLKLIFPVHSYYPREIIKGFLKFCQQYGFMGRVFHNVATEPVMEGEAYINLREEDLVAIIERMESLNLIPGKQLGIISYNETPMKKYILKGITTISTNFSLMGSLAAQLILKNSQEHIEVPFSLTLRNSL
ncbi:GntR family transcriptional regulator [Pedobacter sp. AW31-3R]|uniref:GntR family transcriptional regulator n=1 Tax=Pedobacter sp. AW31-3R TaxID=3445781 RepID=UPI003F9FD521